jgi:hypothetical protein
MFAFDDEFRKWLAGNWRTKWAAHLDEDSLAFVLWHVGAIFGRSNIVDRIKQIGSPAITAAAKEVRSFVDPRTRSDATLQLRLRKVGGQHMLNEFGRDEPGKGFIYLSSDDGAESSPGE